MRRSKYPSLGILDALFRMSYGFSFNMPYKIERDSWYKTAKKDYQMLSRSIFNKKIYKLRASGYIKNDNHNALKLDSKGLKKLKLYSIAQLRLKNKIQDGHPRIIIFDIPESKRYVRDLLRKKLFEFDCKQIQKSVYISKYICDDEINKIAKLASIEKNIHVMKLAKN